MLLWGKSSYSASVILAKNCVFSFGTVVAPLITSIFLIPLTRLNELPKDFAFENSTSLLDEGKGTSFHQMLHNDGTNVTVSTNNDIEDISLVRYAFVPGGVVYCTAGIIFRFASVYTKLTFRCCQKGSVEQEPSTRVYSPSLGLQILKLSMYVILFFNGWLAMIVIQLLSTLMQCDLGWDADQTTRLMTIFYAMFLFGRIISIPSSLFIVSEIIIAANLVAQILGIAALLFAYSGIVSSTFYWIGSGCLGIGISTVIGNVFAWTANNDNMSSSQSASLMISSYLGVIIGSALTGLVMDFINNMSLLYSMLLSIGMQLIGFLGAFVCTRTLTAKQKKYIPLDESK